MKFLVVSIASKSTFKARLCIMFFYCSHMIFSFEGVLERAQNYSGGELSKCNEMPKILKNFHEECVSKSANFVALMLTGINSGFPYPVPKQSTHKIYHHSLHPFADHGPS